MSELRTLLDIFQNEPDDAEICRKNASWISVVSCKKTDWTWRELNLPIWTVRRKPRMFEAYINEAGNLTTTPIGSVRKIKLVEVIE